MKNKKYTTAMLTMKFPGGDEPTKPGSGVGSGGTGGESGSGGDGD